MYLACQNFCRRLVSLDKCQHSYVVFQLLVLDLTSICLYVNLFSIVQNDSSQTL